MSPASLWILSSDTHMMPHANHLVCGIAILGSILASHRLLADEVAVVSAKNAVTTLSKTQVADIFLGKTTRFPDGSQAVPIDQSEGTLARDEFYSNVVGKSAAQMKAYWSRVIFTGRGQPPKAVASSSEAKRLVAASRNAIAYIDSKQIDDTLKVVTITQQ
jgi:ABC-type phosphate transport system substrate-binding protein